MSSSSTAIATCANTITSGTSSRVSMRNRCYSRSTTTSVVVLLLQLLLVVVLYIGMYYYDSHHHDYGSSCGGRRQYVSALPITIPSLLRSGSSSTSSTSSDTTTTMTTTCNETCYFGIFTKMHHIVVENDDEECIEYCVWYPTYLLQTSNTDNNNNPTSSSYYQCGSCPTTTETTTNNTSTTTTTITYQPGNLYDDTSTGLQLSIGLSARMIGKKDELVVYYDGSVSEHVFHPYPDAGGTFIDPNPNNVGGWIYVSNSEYRVKFEPQQPYLGGVYAITFDSNGNIIQYQPILQNTTANCGGGKTPWNTWISCEEYEEYGMCYEVDPTGGYYTIPNSTTTDGITIYNTELYTGGHNISMTSLFNGLFESFAYDIVNISEPHYYVTKDDPAGELRRYTSTDMSLDDFNTKFKVHHRNNPYYYTVLTNPNGRLDFLVVVPDVNDDTNSSGTYYWTTDYDLGSSNAKQYFPNVEGIDVVSHQLYFISKIYYTMYILDLQTMTYMNVTTRSGLFDGQPDQIDIVLHPNLNYAHLQYYPTDVLLNSHQYNGNNNNTSSLSHDTMLLYFTEDVNRTAGIHGRTITGEYVPIVQSTYYNDETTGLAFSPDYRYMYFAYQTSGVLFEIHRTDHLPFYGTTLGVKYHIPSNNVE